MNNFATSSKVTATATIIIVNIITKIIIKTIYFINFQR
jgi:hypothetical protein